MIAAATAEPISRSGIARKAIAAATSTMVATYAARDPAMIMALRRIVVTINLVRPRKATSPDAIAIRHSNENALRFCENPDIGNEIKPIGKLSHTLWIVVKTISISEIAAT